jgi:hypothetical protein
MLSDAVHHRALSNIAGNREPVTADPYDNEFESARDVGRIGHGRAVRLLQLSLTTISSGCVVKYRRAGNQPAIVCVDHLGDCIFVDGLRKPMDPGRVPSEDHLIPITLSFLSCLTMALAYSLPNFLKSFE